MINILFSCGNRSSLPMKSLSLTRFLKWYGNLYTLKSQYCRGQLFQESLGLYDRWSEIWLIDWLQDDWDVPPDLPGAAGRRPCAEGGHQAGALRLRRTRHKGRKGTTKIKKPTFLRTPTNKKVLVGIFRRFLRFSLLLPTQYFCQLLIVFCYQLLHLVPTLCYFFRCWCQLSSFSFLGSMCLFSYKFKLAQSLESCLFRPPIHTFVTFRVYEFIFLEQNCYLGHLTDTVVAWDVCFETSIEHCIVYSQGQYKNVRRTSVDASVLQRGQINSRSSIYLSVIPFPKLCIKMLTQIC